MKAAAFGSIVVTLHGFKILAFNTRMARRTKGSITLMIMLGTEGMVVEDVKVCRLERRITLKANKTSAVVATCEASIGGRDGFAGNSLPTSFALALGAGGRSSRRTRNWESVWLAGLPLC